METVFAVSSICDNFIRLHLCIISWDVKKSENPCVFNAYINRFLSWVAETVFGINSYFIIVPDSKKCSFLVNHVSSLGSYFRLLRAV